MITTIRSIDTRLVPGRAWLALAAGAGLAALPACSRTDESGTEQASTEQASTEQAGSEQVDGTTESQAELQTDTAVDVLATAMNTDCPISKRPITEAGGLVQVGDDAVGFCCGGCRARFDKLAGDKQAEFVSLAKQGRTADFEI